MIREDKANARQNCLAILSESGWANAELTTEEWVDGNPDGQVLKLLLIEIQAPLAHWTVLVNPLRWVVSELMRLYESDLLELETHGTAAIPSVRTAIADDYANFAQIAPWTAAKLIKALNGLMKSIEEA